MPYFNPKGTDEYTKALMDLLGKVAMSEWEEKRKQDTYKKNLEALKSGGFGDIYPKGISGEGNIDYGIRGEEEKIKLADQISQYQRQQDIGKMMKSQAFLKQPPQPVSNVNLLGMAKTGQKPEAKTMTTTGQRLLARQAVKETPPELLGKRFLLGVQGYREGTPEEMSKEKQPTWIQEQKRANVKSGLKRGEITFKSDWMGTPQPFPIKTLDDAYKAISASNLDPAEFTEELKRYEEIIVEDKKKNQFAIPRWQLKNAIEQGYKLIK